MRQVSAGTAADTHRNISNPVSVDESMQDFDRRPYGNGSAVSVAAQSQAGAGRAPAPHARPEIAASQLRIDVQYKMTLKPVGRRCDIAEYTACQHQGYACQRKEFAHGSFDLGPGAAVCSDVDMD